MRSHISKQQKTRQGNQTLTTLGNIHWVVPPPSNSGNEGLGWDSLLKMVHNPGGDWNPGRGDNPKYTSSMRNQKNMGCKEPPLEDSFSAEISAAKSG